MVLFYLLMEDSFGSTLNLNDGKISIYYVEKSIKNTTIAYRNDSLFEEYAGVV